MTDLSCLSIAKLVITSPVIGDVIERSLTEIMTLVFDIKTMESAPVMKGLIRSN